MGSGLFHVSQPLSQQDARHVYLTVMAKKKTAAHSSIHSIASNENTFLILSLNIVIVFLSLSLNLNLYDNKPLLSQLPVIQKSPLFLANGSVVGK